MGLSYFQGHSEQTGKDVTYISQECTIVTISHQLAHLRKSTSSSLNQNHLINTLLSEGEKSALCRYGPCPLGDYSLESGSNKHRGVINIDKDEECIFCKPHCRQTEQFVVITDLSRIQISDPKAPLSGCYFQYL